MIKTNSQINWHTIFNKIFEAVKPGRRTGFPAFELFAGAAILMMLANSMIPEAYEHGGKLDGVFTVPGFFVSVSKVILENVK